MIYDIFIDSLKNGDPFDFFMGLFAWAIGLSIAGLLIAGLLYLIDSSFMQEQEGTGKIVDMVYHPARTYTTFTHVNKVSIPQVHHVSESWGCVIQVNGLTDEVSVSKHFYDTTPIGQPLKVTFTNGRIWDSLYVKRFTLK